ncbi:ATP-dependent endonuclease [Leptospira bouyouniensis]|uniref:ATP-dependent endonuclease n=1 Tax=Leptospira bouyouniensis TaxID=2484911 RepID=A0A7I0HU16_9LEPT|nr:AAA family ATPase [Leptospira bouyouniensis]TGL07499.1 ATP-dependent endonuclease [Leptospira bouyouniensis]
MLNQIIIKGYKSLKNCDLSLREGLNIIVGNNDVGKSSLLEAMHLGLTATLNGKLIQNEISPYLFNKEITDQYLNSLPTDNILPPPSIKIEIYFKDFSNLTSLKGTNNSLKLNVPGVALKIEFDQAYSEEYKEYIKDPSQVRTLPTEYYSSQWISFAGNTITHRSQPFGSSFIDASLIKNNSGTDKYLSRLINDKLTTKEKVDLSLAFRKLKEEFAENPKIKEINDELKKLNGEVSDKELSISVDNSAKSSWENGIIPYLADIPFTYTGKGEQSTLKIKVSLENSLTNSFVFLIEEPENHLSYTNMSKLIDYIEKKCKGKQVFITTHSSYVLNKLRLENVILFSQNSHLRLDDIPSDTSDYFEKLPGYETLRLILGRKAILVEGPSDELIVQRAYFDLNNKLPIDDGIDVISVNSLAFKRFLEISQRLKIETVVLTDNDQNIDAIKKKYKAFENFQFIRILFDSDISSPTLEPQLVKVNELDILNKILDKEFSSKDDLIKYMVGNKTDVALRIFKSDRKINYPKYILDAFQ